MGNPRPSFIPGNLKARTPEREAVVNDLHAVARELRARNAVAEIRLLYESEDDPVRSRAATQFWAFDPETAQAAYLGVSFGQSTREALRLTKLARDTPAEVPDLTALSADQLVEKFVDGSIRLYATRFLDCIGDRGDLEVRNRIVPHVWDPARELKSRGALARLVPLMDHANDRVRLNATIASLDIEPQKAEAILQDFAKGARAPFDMMDAKRSLRSWREGETVVWGVV
jgi:HEAT repeat protein